jgi:hypothetical protein
MWIAVVQVLAKLGAIIPEGSSGQLPPALHTLCVRLLEPSATALRLLVEQAHLHTSMPAVPWLMFVALLTVPLNVALWQAFWSIATADHQSFGRPGWSSRLLKRQERTERAPNDTRGWGLSSSMTASRR